MKTLKNDRSLIFIMAKNEETIEKGIRRTVWVPSELEDKVESVRLSLGLSKSAIWKYAMIKLLQDLGVLKL